MELTLALRRIYGNSNVIASDARDSRPFKERTMTIDYGEKIPNNVNLGGNKTLQRALEHWQPEFLRWWADMGPDGTSATR